MQNTSIAYTLLIGTAPSASKLTDHQTSPGGTTFTVMRQSPHNLTVLVAIAWRVNHHCHALHEYLRITSLSLLHNSSTRCFLMAFASFS